MERVQKRASWRVMEVHAAAVGIQSKLRGLLARKQYRCLSFERAVCNYRVLVRRILLLNGKYLARRIISVRLKAAIKLQRQARLFLKRKKFLVYLRKRIAQKMAVRIQRAYKLHRAHLRYLKRKEAHEKAIVI